MLRLLSLSGLLAMGTVAEAPDLAEAERRAARAQETAREAVARAATSDTTEMPEDFNASVERAARVAENDFPALAEALTDPATRASIATLMEEAEALAASLRQPAAAEGQLAVYVIASFSMPEASLRALIQQGELAGAPVVLRGLVDNSIEATLEQVQTLYEETTRPEPGVLIDPTLFARFAIDQVPTVVVAESPAETCTEAACPTPRHVKIAGDVPLRYALDAIARAKPAYRDPLQPRLAALEPGKAW